MDLEEFADSLLKKDDDATILDVDPYTGDLLIETSISDLPGEIVPSTLLEDERDQMLMDILVRMTRILFLVNALMAFVAIMIGTVPYFVLLTLPKEAALYTTIAFGAYCVGLYFVMLATHELSFTIAWMFTLCMTLGAASAVVRDVAPLQAATIVFMQSIAVVMYTAYSRRKVKVWVATTAMLVVGLIVWVIGIYAFIEQQDWISGGVVLALSVAFAAYSGLQVRYIDRYSLSKKDMTRAVVNFYGDPILWVFRLCK